MIFLALMLAAAPLPPAQSLSLTQPLTSAQPLMPEAPPLSGPVVVVLWASWCASCRAEIERLPKLSIAAAPLSIRTLAIDPPDRARTVLKQRHQPIDTAYADPRDPRTVLNDWGGPGAVLPIAVALDRDGRVCGRKLGLLGTDQLREWARRCRR